MASDGPGNRQSRQNDLGTAILARHMIVIAVISPSHALQ